MFVHLVDGPDALIHGAVPFVFGSVHQDSSKTPLLLCQKVHELKILVTSYALISLATWGFMKTGHQNLSAESLSMASIE